MSREGKRIRTEHLELRVVASLLPHPRVGIVVGKHKHTSVERNRLKRRLREIARCELLPVLPSVDLVIRARPEAYATDHAHLARELTGTRDRLARIHRASAPPGSTESKGSADQGDVRTEPTS